MDEIEREILFNRARSWVLEAGNMIKTNMYAPLAIDTKSNRKDLVTELDRQVEFFFTKHIKNFYPNHSIISEEGYGDDVTNEQGIIWIIDPIDGTMNFVQQKANFAISIGIYIEGVGEIGLIYNVVNNDLYSCLKGNGVYKNKDLLPLLNDDIKLDESVICLSHRWFMKNNLVDEQNIWQLSRDVRGLRSYGAATIEITYVLEGAAQAYLSMGLEPWDMGAARIMLEELGAKLTDLKGNEIPILSQSPMIAANKSIHSLLINKYLQKEKVT